MKRINKKKNVDDDQKVIYKYNFEYVGINYLLIS